MGGGSARRAAREGAGRGIIRGMSIVTARSSTGVTVVTETVPAVRSVAVGCWLDTGSRDERPHEAGAAHFLEHLLFKGTDRLSARDISETFDAIGALSNAFTSKERTCFWACLLDSELDTGMDLLAEMLQRPAFRPEEIDSERQVVIEEINMNEDDPSDAAHEMFIGSLFLGHPLGSRVLGTRNSIGAMTGDDLAGYWGRRYGSDSCVVAVAGNAQHERVMELVEKHFGEWETPETGRPLREVVIETPARVTVKGRDTEQAHLVMGGLSITASDEARFALSAMQHILGGGMSSRLFQKIREERGLAYAVHSFSLPFTETGAWGVYVGTTPATVPEVMEILNVELAAMAERGVTAAELERAKGHMRGSLALSMEDTQTRMVRLGRNHLIGLPQLSLDERLARIDRITAGEVLEVAERVIWGPRVLGAVGPLDSAELTIMML